MLTGSYESFATSKKGSTRVGLSVHGGRYEIYLGMDAEAKQASDGLEDARKNLNHRL